MSSMEAEETLKVLCDEIDADFVKDIVQKYIESYQETIVIIKESLAQQNKQELASKAHFMISSSAYVGGNTLGQLFRELEEMAKADDLSKASEKIAEIEAEYQEIKKVLDKYC